MAPPRRRRHWPQADHEAGEVTAGPMISQHEVDRCRSVLSKLNWLQLRHLEADLWELFGDADEAGDEWYIVGARWHLAFAELCSRNAAIRGNPDEPLFARRRDLEATGTLDRGGEAAGVRSTE